LKLKIVSEFVFLQICEGFPKLYERAQKAFTEALARGVHKPLFIRPSAQWYTFEERLEGVGSGMLPSSVTNLRCV
jgi:DNA cross-link repair 1A protein